jgi:hypothetical protein
MATVTSLEVGNQICEALGLSGLRVVSIDIHIGPADSPVTVDAQIYPDKPGMVAAATILGRYKLVSRDTPNPEAKGT